MSSVDWHGSPLRGPLFKLTQATRPRLLPGFPLAGHIKDSSRGPEAHLGLENSHERKPTRDKPPCVHLANSPPSTTALGWLCFRTVRGACFNPRGACFNPRRPIKSDVPRVEPGRWYLLKSSPGVSSMHPRARTAAPFANQPAKIISLEAHSPVRCHLPSPKELLSPILAGPQRLP